jgi:hypothetical protein
MQTEQIVLEHTASAKLRTDEKFSRRLEVHFKHAHFSVTVHVSLVGNKAYTESLSLSFPYTRCEGI